MFYSTLPNRDLRPDPVPGAQPGLLTRIFRKPEEYEARVPAGSLKAYTDFYKTAAATGLASADRAALLERTKNLRADHQSLRTSFMKDEKAVRHLADIYKQAKANGDNEVRVAILDLLFSNIQEDHNHQLNYRDGTGYKAVTTGKIDNALTALHGYFKEPSDKSAANLAINIGYTYTGRSDDKRLLGLATDEHRVPNFIGYVTQKTNSPAMTMLSELVAQSRTELVSSMTNVEKTIYSGNQTAIDGLFQKVGAVAGAFNYNSQEGRVLTEAVKAKYFEMHSKVNKSATDMGLFSGQLEPIIIDEKNAAVLFGQSNNDPERLKDYGFTYNESNQATWTYRQYLDKLISPDRDERAKAIEGYVKAYTTLEVRRLEKIASGDTDQIAEAKKIETQQKYMRELLKVTSVSGPEVAELVRATFADPKVLPNLLMNIAATARIIIHDGTKASIGLMDKELRDKAHLFSDTPFQIEVTNYDGTKSLRAPRDHGEVEKHVEAVKQNEDEKTKALANAVRSALGVNVTDYSHLEDLKQNFKNFISETKVEIEKYQKELANSNPETQGQFIDLFNKTYPGILPSDIKIKIQEGNTNKDEKGWITNALNQVIQKRYDEFINTNEASLQSIKTSEASGLNFFKLDVDKSMRVAVAAKADPTLTLQDLSGRLDASMLPSNEQGTILDTRAKTGSLVAPLTAGDLQDYQSDSKHSSGVKLIQSILAENDAQSHKHGADHGSLRHLLETNHPTNTAEARIAGLAMLIAEIEKSSDTKAKESALKYINDRCLGNELRTKYGVDLTANHANLINNAVDSNFTRVDLEKSLRQQIWIHNQNEEAFERSMKNTSNFIGALLGGLVNTEHLETITKLAAISQSQLHEVSTSIRKNNGSIDATSSAKLAALGIDAKDLSNAGLIEEHLGYAHPAMLLQGEMNYNGIAGNSFMEIFLKIIQAIADKIKESRIALN